MLLFRSKFVNAIWKLGPRLSVSQFTRLVVSGPCTLQMESLAAAYGSDEEDEGTQHDSWIVPELTSLSSTKITVNCAPGVPDKASDVYCALRTPNPPFLLTQTPVVYVCICYSDITDLTYLKHRKV